MWGWNEKEESVSIKRIFQLENEKIRNLKPKLPALQPPADGKGFVESRNPNRQTQIFSGML